MGKSKRTVTRKCAVCGGIFPKKDLFRIVRDPSGLIRPDPAGKAAGRGAYLCHDRSCLMNAGKKRALERSFHCGVDRQVYDYLRDLTGESPGGKPGIH